MKKLTLTLIVLLGIFGYASARQTHETHFNRKHIKPIVKAELNGKKAYFLLDTGSDICILNEKDSRKFDFGGYFSKDNFRQVSGLGESQKAIQKAYKTRLFLEEQELTANFYVYDLENVVRSLQLKTGVRIAGIIGADLMRKYKFTIHFGEKMATFIAPNSKKKLEELPQIASQ